MMPFDQTVALLNTVFQESLPPQTYARTPGAGGELAYRIQADSAVLSRLPTLLEYLDEQISSGSGAKQQQQQQSEQQSGQEKSQSISVSLAGTGLFSVFLSISLPLLLLRTVFYLFMFSSILLCSLLFFSIYVLSAILYSA